MRIEHIYLKNYRCFDAISVDFNPQMTVFVATNGQGKTSVLDAIKVALWPYVAGFDLGSTTTDVTGIHIDDVRREQVQSHEMDWRLPAEIKAMGQLQVRQLVLDGTLKNPLPESEGSMLDVAVTFHENVPLAGCALSGKRKKGHKNQRARYCRCAEISTQPQRLWNSGFFQVKKHHLTICPCWVTTVHAACVRRKI